MYKQDEPELNFENVLSRLRSIFGRFRFGGGAPIILLALVLVAALFWAGTGFYTVNPGEKAAIRMFGDFSERGKSSLVGGTGPGLHWWWPNPLGSHTIVKVDDVRRLELGFRGDTDVPAESLMITGDENIVDAQLLVQYDVKDIELFLFKVIDPTGVTLRDAAETSLRQIVGSRNIDDVLTTEKEVVETETKLLLQRLLDDYETGLRIIGVKLQNVLAPEQVKDAFDDVVRAKEDKERIINLADAYEEGILPVARGDAQRILQEAAGFKAQRVNIATGRAERFTTMLAEYKDSKEITRQRLFLETMEDVLPGVTKYIISTDAGGNLLQFLPLNSATSTMTGPFLR